MSNLGERFLDARVSKPEGLDGVQRLQFCTDGRRDGSEVALETFASGLGKETIKPRTQEQQYEHLNPYIIIILKHLLYKLLYY